MGYLDRTRKFRVFDPLSIPTIEMTDCVLHICSYLEQDNNREFDVLQKNIDLLSSQTISVKPDYRVDLIISINGHIDNPDYIDYFRRIDGIKINSGVYVQIFQRQNIGFQWGGFHDVWMRYKDIKCNWFVTLEADCFFLRTDWLDYLIMEMNNQPLNVGYFGHRNKEKGGKYIVGPCDQNTINPLKLDDHTPIPIEAWRDKNNQVIQDINVIDTCHTRGGFYFCRKALLRDMDQVFGCFSFSMGCNHEFDAIVLGEVGFGQKARVLGYDWLAPESDDLIGVRRTEGRREY